MTSALIRFDPACHFAHLEGGVTRLLRYSRLLPVINHENRQCGFAQQEAMVEGGVIKSAFCRHPIAPFIRKRDKRSLN